MNPSIGSLGLVAMLLACHPPASSSSPPHSTNVPDEPHGYPGPLLDPEQLGRDFQWRQRVTAQWGSQQARTFDAVLTKTDGELLLLGLGPMGTPGFVLRLRSGAVEFENHSPQKVPFDPQYIVLDVERVFFPWIPGPLEDGVRTHVAHGEQITETWHAGNLQQRTFQRLEGGPQGVITVTYSGWAEGSRAPARAELENGWFGYRLTIETLEQQTL